MKYKEAKNYAGPVRKARVLSNVLSPSKHDLGTTVSIIGVCNKDPNLLWTKSCAIVDYRDLKFEGLYETEPVQVIPNIHWDKK